jgi:hypothetical protein
MPGAPKSRAVAVILAVFLAFWSFLYTYSISGWKFWLGLGLTIFAWVLNVAVDAARGATTPVLTVFFLVVVAGVWIWSIVDRSITRL